MPRTAVRSAGLSFALVLLLGLAACGDDDSAADETTTTTEAESSDETTTTTEAESSDETTTTTEATPISFEPLSPEELCELLPGPDVEAAVGLPVTEVRAAGNMCEYGFGAFVLRLQDYTGVFGALDGMAGSTLNSALAEFLADSGETGVEELDGIGDGAYQLSSGWVYVVAGPNLLYIDQGFGTVPDDFDADSVFASMAASLGTNL